MKKLITIFFLAVACIAGAQESARPVAIKQGKDYVLPSKTTEPAKPLGANLISNGIAYPIYVSSTGKYFIIRTSKKTGNKYKQYINLPE